MTTLTTYQTPPVSRARVLIAGASPSVFDPNSFGCRFVVEGFETLLGAGQVASAEYEYAEERTTACQPELVIVFGSCLPDCCDYARLRHACDCVGSTLAFWLHDDPYEFDGHVKVLEYADHIFTNDRWTAQFYAHPSVWHLPLAASPTIHSSNLLRSPERFERDVFFCGSGYANRKRVVRDLVDILKAHRTDIFGCDWDTQLAPFCRNERIDNNTLANWYAASRVVLNLPREHDLANRHGIVGSTPGPRTFEAAMAGTAQMFFANSLEILDYFENDREIVLFDGPDDFEQKLHGLLGNPEKLDALGVASRERCLRDHTYAARATVLLERVGLIAPASHMASGRHSVTRNVA